MFATWPLICPSGRPFMRDQTCEDDVLKMNEPISLQIGASGLWGSDVKRTTLGVSRSKVKLVNMMCTKRMSQFCCKLPQVFSGARG